MHGINLEKQKKAVCFFLSRERLSLSVSLPHCRFFFFCFVMMLLIFVMFNLFVETGETDRGRGLGGGDR